MSHFFSPESGSDGSTVAAADRLRVHRVEVRRRADVEDPRAEAVRRDAASLGVNPDSVRVAQVYLIRGALSVEQVRKAASELLASPVLDEWTHGSSNQRAGEQLIEIHPLPGVMDPAAQTVRDALCEMLGAADIEAATGRRYDLGGVTSDEADTLARRLLANPVIHAIHRSPYHPDDFPQGRQAPVIVQHVPLRSLSDDELRTLSRSAHLFLSLDEMRAIRDAYRDQDRDPTDIELETIAQTWSEHCVHKTLRSRILYRSDAPDEALDLTGRPGHSAQPGGAVLIDNLLKSTIAAATYELIDEGVDWTLSVFVDNAGVIAFDDEHAVCVKVETHNHPSAIEPYGGAATGIGGCIRDIIGVGLGAKPIASTDVFCVAPPDAADIPAGCLAPRRILTQIVAGVRDYGNRMGIPTVNGAVWFDERYVGNPLVYCGCVGVMPRHLVTGEPNAGDRIIVIGGRTGRDGVHGATFSSAELTDTHADEFSHAVQIGNAIQEKKALDAILRARDVEGGPLFTAITDCGAGGFSSAVGEMGEQLGAEVHLDRAPLKYEGLSSVEIWISEAQERMVLAVAPERVDALRKICEEESVQMCDLGSFGTPDRELIIHNAGVEVGRLSMSFLHEGLPKPIREALWRAPTCEPLRSAEPHAAAASASVEKTLLSLLAHPNIASKRWIIRQYDHEVQGATIIKPLVGADPQAPGDASVIEPVPMSGRALAIGCGLATGVGDPGLGGDPYLMAMAAIDECVRNLVCVGADPTRIAILDNFCWPSCDDPQQLASLVRACEGCYDAAKAYRTPFISGKDSLNNQFTTDDGRLIEIPPTLLITGVGIVRDKRRCVTMDAKHAGDALLVVGATGDALLGSHLSQLDHAQGGSAPAVNLTIAPRIAHLIAGLIEEGLVLAVHDCSDGGLLVAVAEMLFGASCVDETLGATIDLGDLPRLSGVDVNPRRDCFVETPGRYVIEVSEASLDRVRAALGDAPFAVIGSFNDSGRLQVKGTDCDAAVSALRDAWLAPLDW